MIVFIIFITAFDVDKRSKDYMDLNSWPRGNRSNLHGLLL